MRSVAGRRNTTAIGAMYRRRFMEFSFSLQIKTQAVRILIPILN
jgi:hypothetical protein